MSADTSAIAGHVSAYPKAAVDDFLAAAEAEHRMLLAAIAEADERTRRARAAIGMQRVMVSMLLETQRELVEQRAAAEREAAEILATAELRAQEIVDQARNHATPSEPDLTSDDPSPSWLRARVEEADMIDLPIEEIRHPEPLEYAAPRDVFDHLRADGVEDRDGDGFFSFLRGALVDDEPLGPRFV